MELPELSAEIKSKFRFLNIKNLAIKYCKSGELHKFIYETNSNCLVCSRCQFSDINKLSESDIKLLGKNIDLLNAKKNQEINSIIKKQAEKLKTKPKYIEFINNIQNLYSKSKRHKEDYYNFISLFIDKIETIIGKDSNINNKNQYLRFDTYIIDHDHNGFPLPTPIIIKNTDDKIIFRKNHDFFKTDVIYYINNKLQIDIYYDSITKLLLGYKEKNKPYQYSKRKNIYLKINYSILTILKIFGYHGFYTDISNLVENYNKLYQKPDPKSQLIIKLVLADIGRDRINLLKKIINHIQKYIYRVVYNFDTKRLDPEDISIYFLEKYKNKLNNIKFKSDKQGKFFSGWRIIKDSLFYEPIISTVNLDEHAKYISGDDLNNYDIHGNLILFYIISQLSKLLDLNPDKFIKTTLTYFLLDIILAIHSEFDQDKILTNTELKRFKYILTIDVRDKQEIEDISGTTDGFYEEYVDPEEQAAVEESRKEENEDAEEEQSAIVVEDELDYEIDYEPGVNFQG